jgi:hypothetical protein
MGLSDMLESNEGKILLSILLGLGLASMFRQICKKGNCIVIKGPPRKETESYFYKIRDECYKYTPYIVPCNGNGNGENVSDTVEINQE